jgi:hypothetical protein
MTTELTVVFQKAVPGVDRIASTDVPVLYLPELTTNHYTTFAELHRADMGLQVIVQARDAAINSLRPHSIWPSFDLVTLPELKSELTGRVLVGSDIWGSRAQVQANILIAWPNVASRLTRLVAEYTTTDGLDGTDTRFKMVVEPWLRVMGMPPCDQLDDISDEDYDYPF